MPTKIIVQRRGKGSPTYTANSHKYFGAIGYPAKLPNTMKGEVMDIVNSAGHSAPLMVIKYEDGQVSLTPAPLGIRQGQEVYAGDKAPVEVGNVLNLGNIPSGTSIFNLELKPHNDGKIVRTSGGFAQVVSREKKGVVIKLPSKKVISLHPNCRATVGVIAGGGRPNKPFVKAGKKHHAMRARGKLYPRTSAVAMNPVDHPFGKTHSKEGVKRPTSRSRHLPPGAKVGQISPRKTGRGK